MTAKAPPPDDSQLTDRNSALAYHQLFLSASCVSVALQPRVRVSLVTFTRFVSQAFRLMRRLS